MRVAIGCIGGDRRSTEEVLLPATREEWGWARRYLIRRGREPTEAALSRFFAEAFLAGMSELCRGGEAPPPLEIIEEPE